MVQEAGGICLTGEYRMANHTDKGVFKKGDPRINRKGRPRNFDGLRELALVIANEKIASKDNTVVMSRVELILRNWAASGNDKLVRAFIETAYGKVPDELNVDIQGKLKVLEVVKDYGNDPRPD
jgi:hypothetical protein